MYKYVICNQADSFLFTEQCCALEKNIPGLIAGECYEDVDGTKVQTYTHSKGTIVVRNDAPVDVLLVTADFDLTAYFN